MTSLVAQMVVSAYNAGDPGSIPESGRSPEGNGNPLQYSRLMDGGAWKTAVHGVAKSQLSDFTHSWREKRRGPSNELWNTPTFI